MDKLDPKTDGASLDIVQENVAKLKQIFPDVTTEGKIDFDALKETLGEYIDGKEERYSFSWHGKSLAKRIAQTPSTGTLRPCKEESKNWDTTENLLVEGDNLEILKLLQKSYHKKIKMIYIDPPYNTGGNFIYSDNFKDNIKNYLELTGQTDEEGRKLKSNPETSGRYHTDWLNMMYPRLKLARNLLQNDGVIFISIDDNEVSNLRKLCDEVFGGENFVAQIMPIANPGGRDYNQVAVTHEYLLVYAKTDEMELNEIEKIVDFRFNDKKGGYNLRELRNRNPKFHSGNRPNLFYSFYINPLIKDEYDCCPVSIKKNEQFPTKTKPYNSQGKESVWRWGKQKSQENIVNNDPVESQIVAKQKADGNWNIYEKNRRSTTKVKSVWDETEMRTENGTRVIRDLFKVTPFDHPKSISLMKRCIKIGSSEGIVIDLFAGSCSTAHAIMDLNREDGSNRKFIMVQLPEPCDEKSEAFKAGYKTIAEIGKERIRRAGEKILAESKEKQKKDAEDNPLLVSDSDNKDSVLDIGFKVFKLDTSNIVPWDGEFDSVEQDLFDAVDNIKSDRSEEDILYEILLKYGLDLTLPIEERTIEGKKVYILGLGALVICLDKEVSIEAVEGIGKLKEELHPEVMRVVFKDSGFKDDVVKTNAIQILKRYDIEDVKSL